MCLDFCVDFKIRKSLVGKKNLEKRGHSKNKEGCIGVGSSSTAQWEFGRPTLTPTNLEDKTEVKVD